MDYAFWIITTGLILYSLYQRNYYRSSDSEIFRWTMDVITSHGVTVGRKEVMDLMISNKETHWVKYNQEDLISMLEDIWHDGNSKWDLNKDGKVDKKDVILFLRKYVPLPIDEYEERKAKKDL